jgi:hypothetical protein
VLRKPNPLLIVIAIRGGRIKHVGKAGAQAPDKRGMSAKVASMSRRYSGGIASDSTTTPKLVASTLHAANRTDKGGPVPTPHIFDFDETELANYQPEKIDKILIEQPALYANHLRIAHNLAGWATKLETPEFSVTGIDNEESRRGFIQALREVAARLRQGHYVEGGPLMTARALSQYYE